MRSTGPLCVLREYLEVVAVIGAVTLIAWLVPVDYRVFGDIYLLAVIALCLRVGQWAVLFATIISVLAWNFFIVPPRMSFSRLDLKDGVFLGTYFFVALIAGQLTARIRAQERRERQREQRATALFHLTRALSAARTLDEAVDAALRQSEALFGVPTALLIVRDDGSLALHAASSFQLDSHALACAELVSRQARESTTSVDTRPKSESLHLPIMRHGTVLGVFSVRWPSERIAIQPEQLELMDAFAAQIGLLVEREQLRAASEREKLLAESDRLHRTLLDSVSHELKTPVAVLRSAAEGIGKENGLRREALALEILTATQRLDHLVANLLNQSRLEAGRLEPQLDWCDVRDLIGAARRAVAESLSSRPFKVEVPEEMPLFMADAVLMEQVLANLLLNAIHHTPAGTAIAISAGKEPHAGRVFIAVADRGPGISPASRGKLFQKFERGEHAHAGGLGLGLSIVRGFMLAQGGEVVADENPGGGARFTVYLSFMAHETVPHE